MGLIPNSSTLNVKAIESLIEVNRLEEAFVMLKNWADESQTPYRKEVIHLISRYNEIIQREGRGVISDSEALIHRNKLKWDFLYFIERCNTVHPDYQIG